MSYWAYLPVATGALLYVLFRVDEARNAAREERWTREHRAVRRSRIDEEWELEFANGLVVRSDSGYVWYWFPSGKRAPLEVESRADAEFERLERLAKWSESE